MMDKRRLGMVAALVAGGILLLGSLGTASAQMVGPGGSGMMGGGSTNGYSGSGMMGGASGGYSVGGTGMVSGAGTGAMMSLDDARAAMLQYMADQGLDYMSLSGMVRGDQGYVAMMVDPNSGSPVGGLMVDGSGNVSQVSLDMMANLGYGGMMGGR